MEAKIKSLEKAMNVLGCFTVTKPELGITDISQELDLYKSTVHNIVSTLELCGYLEQNTTTGKYRLGLKILELSHVLSSTMGSHNVIHRCLTELVEETDETCYFAIPKNEDVIYMDGAFPDRMYNTRWVQGMKASMVCTGIGKAMLAYMSDDFIENLLSKPLIKHTDYSITDPDVMREELRLTRARGYSIDNMEHEYGIKCVGVPVFNRQGEIVGGLSTTGPSLRFNDEQIVIFSNMLRKKAEDLGQRF
ncbi:MAG: IclR family transcriptional regulator [Lachnospiraceae bacterium]|nr:IclR family transcriptional regulator [Lachnospiraceae bacterium]